MRYICAALLMLMSSVVAASAQAVSTAISLESELKTLAAQAARSAAVPPASAVSTDDVVARLMTFDRDRDGKVTSVELSERMHSLITQGDQSGDGALDLSEVRALALTQRQFPIAGLRNLGGSYGFADGAGQSSRTHIENSIDDLRLAENVSQEAKRIAGAFVDQFEGAALARLRQALAPMVSAEQLPGLERELKSLASFQASITMLRDDRLAKVPIAATISNLSRQVLSKRQLSDDQIKIAEAAIETFKAEQQLDEARQNLLVAELSEILTSDESGDLRAALARRPLAKGPLAGFQQVNGAGVTFRSVR